MKLELVCSTGRYVYKISLFLAYNGIKLKSFSEGFSKPGNIIDLREL